MRTEAQAKKEADDLCELLGKEWKPIVWENLGWHCCVKMEKADGIYLAVYPMKLYGKMEFWVDSRLPEQFSLHCVDPKQGVQDVLNNASRIAEKTLHCVMLFK